MDILDFMELLDRLVHTGVYFVAARRSNSLVTAEKMFGLKVN